ncbi:MAG: Flippase-like protein [Actinomycetota bacterium]|nr:Flippase-like protein [Actinomycetota bacterium]
MKSSHRLQHAAVGDVPDRPRHLLRRIALGLVAVIALGFIAYSINKEFRQGSSVTQAIAGLTPWWVLGLGVGAALVMLLTTWTTLAPLPQLGFRGAFLSQHASQAVGNLVPGPSALAVRFTMLRTYGVNGDDFARATVTVSLVTTVMTASMPIVGMALLAAVGAQDPQAQSLIPVAVAATVLAVLVVAGSGLLLGSSRATAAIARAGNRAVAGGRRLLRRPAGEDPGVAGAMRLRSRLIDGLRASGRQVVLFVAVLYWANGLLLVVSLWAAGVPTSALGIVAGLAVYTIGRLSTLVQITPGGVGVVEVAYTAAYTAYLGQQYQGVVFAGVVLYRFGTYALPIGVGLVSAGIWAVTARRRYRDEELQHAAGLDLAPAPDPPATLPADPPPTRKDHSHG